MAFLPTNMPPGIDVSEDPLLQGRLFSYQDTQLSRLGTVNFHQLPINRAKGCPFQNFQRDGHMQTQVFTGRANYEPNSLADGGEAGGPREDPKVASAASLCRSRSTKVRLRAETFADHYSQARLFYRSQSGDRAGPSGQCHRVRAVEGNAASTSASACWPIWAMSTRRWPPVSPMALNIELPPKSKAAVEAQDMELSPALRIVGKYPPTLQGRAVGILVTDGADGALIEAVRAAVVAEGATVKIVAPKIGGVKLEGGKILEADGQLAGTPSVLFDAVALVLSKEGCAQLMSESAAIDFVKDAFGHLKAIGFTAAGPAAARQGRRRA